MTKIQFLIFISSILTLIQLGQSGPCRASNCLTCSKTDDFKCAICTFYYYNDSGYCMRKDTCRDSDCAKCRSYSYCDKCIQGFYLDKYYNCLKKCDYNCSNCYKDEINGDRCTRCYSAYSLDYVGIFFY